MTEPRDEPVGQPAERDVEAYEGAEGKRMEAAMTDTPSLAHPFGDFFRLLGVAHSARKRADLFDVHSEVPESKAKWEELCREQAAACLALVRFCAEHHQALIAAFDSESEPQIAQMAQFEGIADRLGELYQAVGRLTPEGPINDPAWTAVLDEIVNLTRDVERISVVLRRKAEQAAALDVMAAEARRLKLE